MYSVIFDMDGTLLDTQKICILAWEHAGLNQGFKGAGDNLSKVFGMNEAGWTEYIRETFTNVDVDRFVAEMKQYIIDNLVVKFMPGAKELLDYLKENNIKIGLASGSSRASILHHLKEVEAIDYFDAIVGGEEVLNGKPAPDIFLLTAERLGVEPKDCFVFEDSSNGILSAHRAGMKGVAVPHISLFSKEIEDVMYAKIESLDKAIEIFENL